MKTIKLGVLGLINEQNELVAIVHHDEQKRSQIMYSTSEMGMEDVEVMLKTIIDNNQNNI